MNKDAQGRWKVGMSNIKLKMRDQTVIELYYDHERTMKEIGNKLGVNESRVSQIHKSALEKLGTALRGFGYPSATIFLEEARQG